MWEVTKALQIPLDPTVEDIRDLPYTISFVVRKRLQIDNFNELSKEKRPTEKIIWEGTSEDLEEWIDTVVRNQGKKTNMNVMISESEIEG